MFHTENPKMVPYSYQVIEPLKVPYGTLRLESVRLLCLLGNRQARQKHYVFGLSVRDCVPPCVHPSERCVQMARTITPEMVEGF